MLSDLELMETRTGDVLTHDAHGRMVAVNEPGDRPAARFYLGRTVEGNVWRVRHDLPPDLAAHLNQLAAAEPVIDDLERDPVCLAAVCAALGRAIPPAGERGGPCYQFPPTIPASDAIAVLPEDAQVMARWLPEWLPDVATRQPFFAVLVDGAAVAVCACARRPRVVTEAGVETHPNFRGHGYAAAATAAWATAVRAAGVIPVYSTSWANTASQRVAAKLGLMQYGVSMAIA